MYVLINLPGGAWEAPLATRLKCKMYTWSWPSSTSGDGPVPNQNWSWRETLTFSLGNLAEWTPTITSPSERGRKGRENEKERRMGKHDQTMQEEVPKMKICSKLPGSRMLNHRSGWRAWNIVRSVNKNTSIPKHRIMSGQFYLGWDGFGWLFYLVPFHLVGVDHCVMHPEETIILLDCMHWPIHPPLFWFIYT